MNFLSKERICCRTEICSWRGLSKPLSLVIGILYHLLAKHDIIGISYFKVVIELNLDYTGLLPSSIYEWKGDRICELYAVKLRMTAPRAIEVRYAFPYTETVWPMVGLSTAEHSFMIAQMIVPTYMEFLELFPYKDILPEQLESEALHHDDAEALTGDAATDVDGVTRAMKDAAEAKSIARQYSGLVCHSYMRVRHESYEARESYLSKLVKMYDAVDLVLFAQYCVQNGVGMIARGRKEDEYVLKAFGQESVVDPRTHKEIKEYLADGTRSEVPISEVMYGHSLPRVERLERPELTGLFKLLCARAFEFPFEKYNLINLPMDFAKLA